MRQTAMPASPGAGALCVTYGVGGFSAYNAVAGAFAERVPLVVVSGGPRTSLRGRLHPYLLHHTLGEMNLQRDIFEKITQYSAVLASPSHAAWQIDEALVACLRYSRPVYLEIPADMVTERCAQPGEWKPDTSLHVDPEVVDEAIEETLDRISRASRPAILAGVEADRLGARDALLGVITRSGFPVATTGLGKGVVPESTRGYAGTYIGSLANETARKTLEEADLLLCLGAWMTDLDLGGYTAHLDENRMIIANSERVKVRHHVYEHVPIKDFLEGLVKRLPAAGAGGECGELPEAVSGMPYVASPGARLTTDRFWARMDYFLDDSHIVVSDTGSCTFESVKLRLPGKADYIGQAFYASMGYGLPAALGAKLAAPSRRPVVFVGDGAFQMTGQELSTVIRHKQNPVVFLLNNDGYQVERAIYDNAYNDISMWDYTQLAEAFGGAPGVKVSTEGDLEAFLAKAADNRDALMFAEVRFDRSDFSATLRTIGEKLR